MQRGRWEFSVYGRQVKPSLEMFFICHSARQLWKVNSACSAKQMGRIFNHFPVCLRLRGSHTVSTCVKVWISSLFMVIKPLHFHWISSVSFGKYSVDVMHCRKEPLNNNDNGIMTLTETQWKSLFPKERWPVESGTSESVQLYEK